MDAGNRCALVTGANKGIGFGIVKKLCREFKGTVYLTARDETRGREALEELKRQGLSGEFLRVDVTDRGSVEKAREVIEKKHGGLDILINNAGISGGSFEQKNEVSAEIAEKVFATNFTGVLNVCDVFFPILRSHARVVNISSGLGTLRNLTIDRIKQRVISDNLTIDELKKIMDNYIEMARHSNPADAGYPSTFGPYSMSKLALNALSRVQQRLLDQDKTRTDVIVNACTPGFVDTDMTNHRGTRTVEEGIDTPVFLALLRSQGTEEAGQEKLPRGEFLRDRKVMDWVGEKDE